MRRGRPRAPQSPANKPLVGKLSGAERDALKRPKPLLGVTMTVDRTDELVRAVAELTKRQVMVGIPAEAAERDPQDGNEINNAAIGYINEWGLPEKNIPARPHLVPGVKDYGPRAIVRLKAAALAVLDGRKPEVDKQLNAIGLEAVSSVRAKITGGLSPPLSPKTIYNRQHRNTKPKRMGTQPLIDFGDYLRHITYVIRKVATGGK